MLWICSWQISGLNTVELPTTPNKASSNFLPSVLLNSESCLVTDYHSLLPECHLLNTCLPVSTHFIQQARQNQVSIKFLQQIFRVDEDRLPRSLNDVLRSDYDVGSLLCSHCVSFYFASFCKKCLRK